MELTYLLDTHILSEPTKPAPSPALLRRLIAHKDRAARWHAEERVRLQKVGRQQKPEQYSDGLIAAVAFVNNLTLITDVKHFEVFQGLRVQNWLKARLS